MSHNKKLLQRSWQKYPNGLQAQKMSKQREAKRFPTNELRELIQNEVYQILGGIKIEIQSKMKQVDNSIVLIRNEVVELKRTVIGKSAEKPSLANQFQGTLKQLLVRMNKIQKQVLIIKNFQDINNLSYGNQSDFSKSNINTYKLGNSGEISGSSTKEKSISPLFAKTMEVDLSAMIFQDDRTMTKSKTIQYGKSKEGSPLSKSQQKKTSIFSNLTQQTQQSQQNFRKPPLPSTDLRSKFITSHEMISSASSQSFYEQQSPTASTHESHSRTNQTISQVNPIQKVEEQLSKNKNVFMRKKKSEEKIESPPKEQEKSFSNHKFQNQLEDFSPTYEDESFNIELQYSKDTFLSDL